MTRTVWIWLGGMGAVLCGLRSFGVELCRSDGCSALSSPWLWKVGLIFFAVYLWLEFHGERIIRNGDSVTRMWLGMGATVEVGLVSYQIFWKTYCLECLGVAVLVFALFAHSLRRGRRLYVAQTVVLAFLIVSLLAGSPAQPWPIYSVVFSPVAGISQVERYTVFFDPRCAHCRELLQDVSDMAGRKFSGALSVQIDLCPVELLGECSEDLADALRKAKGNAPAGEVIACLVSLDGRATPGAMQEVGGHVRDILEANTRYVRAHGNKVPIIEKNGKEIPAAEVKRVLAVDQGKDGQRATDFWGGSVSDSCKSVSDCG